MFRLLVDVPLHVDKEIKAFSAGLADERVSPAEAAKGVVGKLIPAGIAFDGDVFHVCIVAHCGAPASINLKKPIVLSPC